MVLPAPPSHPRRLADFVAVAAAATAGAGVIHLSVIQEHLEEFWLFGVFFVASGIIQLAWAVAILVRPSRPLLLVGVVGNALIAAVWLMSRTVGLPLGPEVWTPEEAGSIDLAATGLQIAAILFVLTVLRAAGRPRRMSLTSFSPLPWVAAAAIAGLVTAVILQQPSSSAADECGGHSDIASSPTGPLFPVDGHAMLPRTTPATRARPNQTVGLVAGILLNCADGPLRLSHVELGTTGDGGKALGTFVVPIEKAAPRRRVSVEALRNARTAEGAAIPPTEDVPALALVVKVRTKPSDATLPFLVSVVVVEYEVDGESYRAPFASIARIEFERG